MPSFHLFKSGKDYTVHSALNAFVQNEDYHIKKAFVVSNERSVTQKGKITYIPIYYIMFFDAASSNGGEFILNCTTPILTAKALIEWE